ncbi:MAG: PhoH family protein [Fibrobacteria bacterium]|nr:PhoH family protein [Fibrobacteria bacterium]
MTKYFVLDTNVLLHNPASLFSFSDNIIVIPFTVIEELDRFKSDSEKKGMHARQVLRQIDSLIKKGALNKGAKMANGGKLKIAFAPDFKEMPDMETDISDNKILAVALDLQRSGNLVFFISKDVNARIKAYALGIKSQDYEKQKVEYSQLYKGWKEITIPQEECGQLYNNGAIAPKGLSFYSNELALVKIEDCDDNKAPILCKWDEDKEGLVTIREKRSCMGIKPLNTEQQFAFELLLNPSIPLVTLVGLAGTGKTLIALACALHLTIGSKPLYDKVLVARPVIPMGNDIGYLPGSKDQKLGYWMRPIFDNLEFILSRGKTELNAINKKKDKILKAADLQSSNLLEVEALTYIRGRSIPNQFLIVDEAQNLTPHEIKTIVSRAGDGTKIVMTGDPEQIDNPYLDANSNGLSYTVERLKRESLFGHVLLTQSERSPLASMAAESL